MWESDSRGRWLRDAPEVRTRLLRELAAEPSLAGRLAGPRLRRVEANGRMYVEATWAPSGGSIVIKLDAEAEEMFWLPAVDRVDPGLVPHVFGLGQRLGGLDLPWLALESIPFDITLEFSNMAEMLAAAAVRFQVAAARIEHSTKQAWDPAWLRACLLEAAEQGCPGHPAALAASLYGDWQWVECVAPPVLNFGDLTQGNARSRVAPPGPGCAVLFDPIPRWGPWLLDGAYCEAMVTDHRLGIIDEMARQRARRGLPNPPGAGRRAADLALGWMAGMWWAIAPWRRSAGWMAKVAALLEAARLARV